MKKIYEDIRKVLRFVKPRPMLKDALGDGAFTEECMYVGMHARAPVTGFGAT